jgi:cellulose synthase/poly-beta-1,6-N-acetylglucosamine synthase-like glycosyltransferase
VRGFSVIIASYGDPKIWVPLADRAEQSAHDQDAYEIIRLHDESATLAQVRNEAGAAALGEWLCFLDADDELAPGYLDAMSHAIVTRTLLGRAERGLFAPAVSHIWPAPTNVTTTPEIPNEGNWPRMNECVIGTVVHKLLFADVGGFREYEAYEDWDLWLRCERAGAEIVYVRDAVYRQYMNPNGRNLSGRLQHAYELIWASYEATG